MRTVGPAGSAFRALRSIRHGPRLPSADSLRPHLSGVSRWSACTASNSNVRQYSSKVPSMWTPTPMIVETVSGGGQYAYDIFSKLLKERIVYVSGPIEDQMASVVTAQLLWLEADNPEREIFMYLNSPGGSVSAGLSILDTMEYISCDVHTIGFGVCASMGSLLLAAGAPKKRSALPHTTIMVHQPSGGYQGTASDISIHAKEILRVREQLNEIYHRHLAAAGKERNMDEIEKLMDRDYFMSAEHALEIGIIDQIVTSRKKQPEGTK